MNGKKTAYGLITAGLVIVLAFTLLYLFKTTHINISAPIDSDIFASYGAIVGGLLGAIFSLAGVFLLINNLQQQESAIERQQMNFNRQLLENRFFELIRIHRENSNQLIIENLSGEKGFLSLEQEFYRSKLIVDAFNESLSEKLTEHERINIAYLCYFFGAIKDNSIKILKENLKHYHNIDSILRDYPKNQKGIMDQDNFQYNIFEGHQSRLGHYYRHLYQSVKYIDMQSNNVLTYREKYEYIKHLRAQLSTQEQTLLFFNSLSDLGKAWENKNENNKKLITKYDLIKNIPKGYTLEINIRKYYPDVFFEGDNTKTENRIKLEETFE